MMKQSLKRMGNEKGLTLIELLAVIVILGVIAAIAVPMIGNVISKSKTDADVATARQLYEAARLYVVGEEGGDFTKAHTVTLTQLTTKGYIDENITRPSDGKKIDRAEVTFDANGKFTGVKYGVEGDAVGSYSRTYDSKYTLK